MLNLHSTKKVIGFVFVTFTILLYGDLDNVAYCVASVMILKKIIIGQPLWAYIVKEVTKN